MASLQNNPFGQISGRIGNTVFYQLNGKTIVRRIGLSTKPPTAKQLAVSMRLNLLTKMFLTMKGFLRAGLFQLSSMKNQQAENMAISLNWEAASVGEYPELKIDFSRIILSQGNLAIADDLAVQPNAEGIAFTWSKRPVAGLHWNDKVMVLAYIPSLKKSVFSIDGTRVAAGIHQLPFYGINHGVEVETYISFLSNNGYRASDSVYLGKVIW